MASAPTERNSSDLRVTAEYLCSLITSREALLEEESKPLADFMRSLLPRYAAAALQLGYFPVEIAYAECDPKLLPISALQDDKRFVALSESGELYIYNWRFTGSSDHIIPGIIIPIVNFDTKRDATNYEVVQMFPVIMEQLKTQNELSGHGYSKGFSLYKTSR